VKKDISVPNVRRRVRKFVGQRLDQLVIELCGHYKQVKAEFEEVVSSLHPFELVIFKLVESGRRRANKPDSEV